MRSLVPCTLAAIVCQTAQFATSHATSVGAAASTDLRGHAALALDAHGIAIPKGSSRSGESHGLMLLSRLVGAKSHGALLRAETLRADTLEQKKDAVHRTDLLDTGRDRRVADRSHLSGSSRTSSRGDSSRDSALGASSSSDAHRNAPPDKKVLAAGGAAGLVVFLLLCSCICSKKKKKGEDPKPKAKPKKKGKGKGKNKGDDDEEEEEETKKKVSWNEEENGELEPEEGEPGYKADKSKSEGKGQVKGKDSVSGMASRKSVAGGKGEDSVSAVASSKSKGGKYGKGKAPDKFSAPCFKLHFKFENLPFKMLKEAADAAAAAAAEAAAAATAAGVEGKPALPDDELSSEDEEEEEEEEAGDAVAKREAAEAKKPIDQQLKRKIRVAVIERSKAAVVTAKAAAKGIGKAQSDAGKAGKSKSEGGKPAKPKAKHVQIKDDNINVKFSADAWNEYYTHVDVKILLGTSSLPSVGEPFATTAGQFQTKQAIMKHVMLIKDSIAPLQAGFVAVISYTVEQLEKVLPPDDDGKGKGKDGKGKKGKKGKGGGQKKPAPNPFDTFAMAIRLQRFFRRYREKKAAGCAKTGGMKLKRGPAPCQKVCLMVEVLGGENMPKLSGDVCDPMVELRALYGDDPNDVKDGRAKSTPKYSIRTEPKDNDQNPRWEETLELRGLANKPDHWMQVILWDKNYMTDTALGHWAIPVTDALLGLDYDPRREGALPKNPKKIADMNSCKKKEKLKSILNLNISYVELHVYHLTISKATDLPIVDAMGTIDGIIEVRICRNDPRKHEFDKVANPNDVMWTGRTMVQSNTTNPVWKKQWPEIELPGIPSLWVQFNLINDNSPLPESNVGQFVISMKEFLGQQEPMNLKAGSKMTPKKLKLEKYSNIDPVGEFKKAKLYVELGYETILDK